MKTWNLYGTGNLKKPVRLVCVQAPGWLIALHQLFGASCACYDWAEKITLPKFVREWRGRWDSDSAEIHTIDEWYGNLLQYWIYQYLEIPALQLYTWVECQPKFQAHTTDMSIRNAEIMFGKDHTDLVWLREHVARQREYEAWSAAQDAQDAQDAAKPHA